jgi:Domain of unknown function (DUF4124)
MQLMKIGIVVALLAMFAVPAAAVTYTWEDDQGTVNFTEDLGSVPQKFRKKAKVLGAEEEEAPPAAKEPKEAAQPVQKGKEAGPAKEQPAEKKDTKKIYGDKPAEAWKSEFAQLNADIKTAEDQLVEMRKRLADTSKMSRSDYLSIQKTIREIENRLLVLREKRDVLNTEANRAEVPAELRGQ